MILFVDKENYLFNIPLAGTTPIYIDEVETVRYPDNNIYRLFIDTRVVFYQTKFLSDVREYVYCGKIQKTMEGSFWIITRL